jgi:alanine racemase
MLYGASPFPGKRGSQYQLKPVMSLSSELIAIHKIAKDERIGYGGEFICPEDMCIGVVGIGYGDGYPQYAKSMTPILVNGNVCPLIGRVSMDMLTVDLRSQPNAKVGNPVLLWGPGLPVEMVAINNNTSAYELLTRMMPRVPVIVT